ncbi:MAG: sugar phosphate isomerase/epimerase [Phycisphaerae bacterium]|nr:sugar phosphate isomerase/epimerase [Phycisphaerae bacterium]
MSQMTEANIGVCSWSLGGGLDDLLSALDTLALRRVHLALEPLRDDPAWAGAGQRLAEAGVTIGAGMMGCIGEDYSTLETIHRTGGLMLDENWRRNFDDARAIAEIAADLNVPQVSFHAGFISPDADQPEFAKLLDRVGQVADVFAGSGIDLLLESGQENGPTLETFLAKLGKPNVGVNFDPANIILYDMGDPVESLRRLMPGVRQVHIKDAVRTTTPGQWGKEVPAGDGQVDWRAFFDVLREGNFTGNLMIEREAGPSRVADIQQAVTMIKQHLA